MPARNISAVEHLAGTLVRNSTSKQAAQKQDKSTVEQVGEGTTTKYMGGGMR